MAEKSGQVCESSGVAVVRSQGEYRLVLTGAVSADAFLFNINGELTSVPTRYTVQVGQALHVDVPDRYGPEDILDRFYWRFMNHSCEPSAVIRGRQVFALKSIQPWQEITFNYNTTEYEMAEPFDCRCGSVRCEGRVQGFRLLARPERERLRPWLSGHLLSLLDSDAVELPAGAKVQVCR